MRMASANRIATADASTFGKLFNHGNFGLEVRWSSHERNNERMGSCRPTGIYAVLPHYSPRFKRVPPCYRNRKTGTSSSSTRETSSGTHWIGFVGSYLDSNA